MDKPSLLKPTLIGGAVFGFLGALPCIGAINVACCALIMGGGFLAAYLYSSDCKKLGLEFRAGEGAKIGVVAGIFYWLVSSVVSGVMQIFMKTDFDQILDQMEEGGMPPEALDTMEQVFDVLGGPMGVVIMLGATLVLGLIFSTIGGLIGGAVFKVAAAPPSPPGSGTVAPPPPPPPVAPGS
jgi:hypothetical protein